MATLHVLKHHCVVVLEQDTFIILVSVQPRRTRPYITEKVVMGCKESNQTNMYFKNVLNVILYIFIMLVYINVL